jgi:hypothetical protein
LASKTRSFTEDGLESVLDTHNNLLGLDKIRGYVAMFEKKSSGYMRLSLSFIAVGVCTEIEINPPGGYPEMIYAPSKDPKISPLPITDPGLEFSNRRCTLTFYGMNDPREADWETKILQSNIQPCVIGSFFHIIEPDDFSGYEVDIRKESTGYQISLMLRSQLIGVLHGVSVGIMENAKEDLAPLLDPILSLQPKSSQEADFEKNRADVLGHLEKYRSKMLKGLEIRNYLTNWVSIRQIQGIVRSMMIWRKAISEKSVPTGFVRDWSNIASFMFDTIKFGDTRIYPMHRTYISGTAVTIECDAKEKVVVHGVDGDKITAIDKDSSLKIRMRMQRVSACIPDSIPPKEEEAPALRGFQITQYDKDALRLECFLDNGPSDPLIFGYLVLQDVRPVDHLVFHDLKNPEKPLPSSLFFFKHECARVHHLYERIKDVAANWGKPQLPQFRFYEPRLGANAYAIDSSRSPTSEGAGVYKFKDLSERRCSIVLRTNFPDIFHVFDQTEFSSTYISYFGNLDPCDESLDDDVELEMRLGGRVFQIVKDMNQKEWLKEYPLGIEYQIERDERVDTFSHLHMLRILFVADQLQPLPDGIHREYLVNDPPRCVIELRTEGSHRILRTPDGQELDSICRFFDGPGMNRAKAVHHFPEVFTTTLCGETKMVTLCQPPAEYKLSVTIVVDIGWEWLRSIKEKWLGYEPACENGAFKTLVCHDLLSLLLVEPSGSPPGITRIEEAETRMNSIGFKDDGAVEVSNSNQCSDIFNVKRFQTANAIHIMEAVKASSIVPCIRREWDDVLVTSQGAFGGDHLRCQGTVGSIHYSVDRKTSDLSNLQDQCKSALFMHAQLANAFESIAQTGTGVRTMTGFDREISSRWEHLSVNGDNFYMQGDKPYKRIRLVRTDRDSHTPKCAIILESRSGLIEGGMSAKLFHRKPFDYMCSLTTIPPSSIATDFQLTLDPALVHGLHDVKVYCHFKSNDDAKHYGLILSSLFPKLTERDNDITKAFARNQEVDTDRLKSICAGSIYMLLN